MLQIVYKSAALPNFQLGELGPILYDARYHNKANAVTGLLLFDGTHFLQALEGEPRDVRDTIARILKDKRHRSIVVLSERATEVREFGNWDMATKVRENADYSKSVIELTELVSCPKVKSLFVNFTGARLD